MRAAPGGDSLLNCVRVPLNRFHFRQSKTAPARLKTWATSSPGPSSGTDGSSPITISPGPTVSPGMTFLTKQATAMFAAGAALGPFCDGLHSQHNVLHYTQPSVQLSLDIGVLHWSFESCWWVPLLFGVAGLILGVSVPLLDHLLGQNHQGVSATNNLSWRAVLSCITLFVVCYWLSSVLEQPLAGQHVPGLPVPAVDAALMVYAVALWGVFDRTPQGLGMAALTAVCGPLVEVALIRFGLYHYTNPTVWGVPTWIPWVYFAGGPAVGNLGRLVWRQLMQQQQQQPAPGS